MALGQFFESPQTGQTDGRSVTGILPSEQPVADQKLDPTHAYFDLPKSIRFNRQKQISKHHNGQIPSKHKY